MYFEARSHRTVNVADPAAAVRLIHARDLHINLCPVWLNAEGQRLALADDSHIDSAWLEVALINLDTHEQVESLTFGWCGSEVEKLKLVLDSLKAPAMRKNVTLPIDGTGHEAIAPFTCGCCGTEFNSTIKEQARFDQDSGFGICPSCQERYYSGPNPNRETDAPGVAN
jgi:hypothetical protein